MTIQYRGRVNEYGAELAETAFVCVGSLPIYPVHSRWSALGGTSHPIRLHGRSVIAGYLQVWAPLLIFSGLAAGLYTEIAYLIAATALAAATAVAWRWRWLRSPAAQRRANFDLLAFGTRCEPRHFSDNLSRQLERDLAARWNDHSPDRTASAVAEHGASDASEAVLAYGLLRLAGDANAERLVDPPIVVHADRPVASADHPYRAHTASLSPAELASRKDELRNELFQPVPPGESPVLLGSLPATSGLAALVFVGYTSATIVAGRPLGLTLLTAGPLFCAIWIYTALRATSGS